MNGEGKGMARPERLELPTYWFVASRSIQLSYGRACSKDTPPAQRESTSSRRPRRPGAASEDRAGYTPVTALRRVDGESMDRFWGIATRTSPPRAAVAIPEECKRCYNSSYARLYR